MTRALIALALLASLVGAGAWAVSSYRGAIAEARESGRTEAVAVCAQGIAESNAAVERARAQAAEDATRASEAHHAALAAQAARQTELEAYARQLESQPPRPAVCPPGGGLSPDSVRALRRASGQDRDR